MAGNAPTSPSSASLASVTIPMFAWYASFSISFHLFFLSHYNFNFRETLNPLFPKAQLPAYLVICCVGLAEQWLLYIKLLWNFKHLKKKNIRNAGLMRMVFLGMSRLVEFDVVNRRMMGPEESTGLFGVEIVAECFVCEVLCMFVANSSVVSPFSDWSGKCITT